MVDELILVYNYKNLRKALEYRKEELDQKIICFDFISHKYLRKLGISHNFAEDYIESKEKELIDNTTREIMFSWYNNDNIKNYLIYKNLNLGWLLENELYGYFLEVIKNFISLKKIIKDEKPKKIISVDSLCDISKEISKKTEIEIIEYTKTEHGDLAFDKIMIPFNFGKSVHNIQVSRKNAIRIKNFLDDTTSLFLSSNIQEEKKSILLVDFNLSLYYDFLKTLSKSNMNIVLLNLRKPAVRNIKDLNFLRKNKIKVINYKKFQKSELVSIVKKNQIDMSEKLEKLFLLKEFESIFQIYGESFWTAIKDQMKQIFLKRFNEAINYFEIVENIFKKINIKEIVTLNDVGYEEKIVLSVANSHNMSGYILQHGMFPDNSYAKKFLNILPIIPKFGFKAAVWGNYLRDHLLEMGVPSEQIITIGSPRHDRFFQDTKAQNNDVVICITPQSSIDFDSVDTREFVKAEDMLHSMIDIIKGKKCNVIIKDHPSQHDLDISSIVHDIDSTIHVYKNQNIFELVKNAKIVICIGYSTVLLEAMILDKPTVLFQIHPNWIDEHGIISNVTNLVKSKDEFEDLLTNLLTDSKFRISQINKGKKFVKEYMTNHGKAAEIFRDVLIN